MKIIASPAPRIGDIKTCRGFALFPTRINQSTTVWMEKYTREKIWFKPMNVPGGWIDEMWGIYDTESGMVYDSNHGRGWRRFRQERPPAPQAMRPIDEEEPEPINRRDSANRYDFMAK